MRYQPVTISHVFEVPGLASMQPRQWLALANNDAKMREFPNYWQARSKMLGDCGHKHKTQKAAEPCKERLLKAWHERRAEQCRAAHKARKLKAQQLKTACETFKHTMPAIVGMLRMAGNF